MAEIPIGRVVIGDGRPVVTIAEAACEHLGNLDVAKRIVDAAKWAGADIVKFQLHLWDEMIPGSIKFWAGSMDEVLQRFNLTVDDHAELMRYCEQVGIQYLCTPFCAKAADILEDLGAPAFKTGSGELTNIPMQQHIAKKGRPMIVSTGMATVEEIGETVAAIKAERCPLILTHCTSAYPPRYDQINLRFIPRLRAMFDVIVGHSDHTPDLWTAIGASLVGARVIEKHFTLDRALKGPDYHISLEPPDFKYMVEGIRKLEDAMGDKKLVYAEEQVVRDWAHHSVVSLADIPAGAAITAEMVGVKRPGSGVPAKHLPEFYGRVAKRRIPANSLIRWEDVDDAPSRVKKQGR